MPFTILLSRLARFIANSPAFIVLSVLTHSTIADARPSSKHETASPSCQDGRSDDQRDLCAAQSIQAYGEWLLLWGTLVVQTWQKCWQQHQLLLIAGCVTNYLNRCYRLLVDTPIYSRCFLSL